jgi:protein translocase SecG subunit
MFTALLVLQFFIVIGLVFSVLMQKTGADSISGLSMTGKSVLSNRAASNLLTKATVIFATAFMINSLILAKIVVHKTESAKSVLSVDAMAIEEEMKKAKAEVPLAK